MAISEAFLTYIQYINMVLLKLIHKSQGFSRTLMK